MAANGVNGGVKGSETLQWKVGLVNHQNKYLTAETFGFKINASGTSLRKKQVWLIEHDEREDETIYIKSHLGRYLSGDKKGNVDCSNEERGEHEKFVIQYNPDGSGKWAIRNKTTGYYFGGTADTLRIYEKTAGQSEWWTVHLAIHPQVNIRNVNRKRYAHLDSTNDKIQFDELIPWGQDALITLEFREGKYAVKTCDNRYLHRDGSLVGNCRPADTLFTLEIRSGQYAGLALKASTGKYLTAVGQNATMQARNMAISKDELFTLEDSHPQAFLTAHNGKKVSTKQGVDLTANQDDLSDKETFQVEFDKTAKRWRLRTVENKYWSLEAASGIQAVGNVSNPGGLFDLEFLEDGALCIKASNGRYVTARMNGSLYAVSDSITEKERFYLTIINRPLLVLKCDFGFVGFKTTGNPRLECNKSNYADNIYLEHSNGKGAAYFLKGHNCKYWGVDPECMINADSAEPQPFIFELQGQSKFLIKAPNGKYIKGEQNGIFSATVDRDRATLWEY